VEVIVRRIVLCAAVSALALLLVPASPASAETCVGEHSAEDHRVTDPSDGVELAITVFRSGYADCADTPVILEQHGWAGSRTTALGQDLLIPGDLDTFLDAGYSVVSIDARGHGDSGGVASVLHPDDELSGYEAILDYLYDNFPWMLRDSESGVDEDLVVGAYGASYGGGFQTLTAAFDGRLDALVPIVTWHDLVQSLAPNGVPRGAWIDLLYTSGTANARLDPRIDEWAAEVALTGEVPEDAAEHFHEASPTSRPGGITAPTLWVQGPPDTLFPLNEGVDNHLDTRGHTDSWLLGVNGGHILPGIQPTGVNAPSRGSLVDWRLDDCVDPVPHTVAFLETFLWGEAGATDYMAHFPRAFVPTEQGGCVAADDWPLADEELVVDLDAVLSGAEFIVELFTAEEDLVLAGIPEFEATVPSLGVPGRVFLSLALGDPEEGGWLINDQVTPFETAGEQDEVVEIDLAGIATEVPEGATVYLRVETTNEQFITRPHNTLPEVVLEDITVRLPVASQGLTGRAEAPEPPVRVVAPTDGGEESSSSGGDEAVPAAAAATMPATGGGAPLIALALWGSAVALRSRR
jgi:ABC-2 type transport system ATP-binding protein